MLYLYLVTCLQAAASVPHLSRIIIIIIIITSLQAAALFSHLSGIITIIIIIIIMCVQTAASLSHSSAVIFTIQLSAVTIMLWQLHAVPSAVFLTSDLSLLSFLCHNVLFSIHLTHFWVLLNCSYICQ